MQVPVVDPDDTSVLTTGKPGFEVVLLIGLGGLEGSVFKEGRISGLDSPRCTEEKREQNLQLTVLSTFFYLVFFPNISYCLANIF